MSCVTWEREFITACGLKIFLTSTKNYLEKKSIIKAPRTKNTADIEEMISVTYFEQTKGQLPNA